MTTANADTNNSAKIKQPSPDLLDRVRAGGKSLSDISQNLMKQLAKNSVSRLTQTPEQQSVINMKNDISNEAQALAKSTSNNASQLFRQQLPGLTRQLLGKRFKTVNKLANMVMPTGTFDKASDQILELLADFASTVSNSNDILEEAGVDSLAELQKDTGRSGRLARALGEKNRYIGMAQGAISGATGVVGAASDIPLSMILIFRTVYLTGRSYGFELDKPQDRQLIFDALSNADLTLIAEKQAILLGLRSLSTMLDTGNLQSLQTMLGSNHDVDPLIKFLSDENGQLKWRLSPSIINKITPLVGGAVGAIYNARILKEVSESASQVFEHARQQALGNGSTQQSGQQATDGDDKLINAVPAEGKEAQATQQNAKEAILHNEDIKKVEVTTRAAHDAKQQDAASTDEKIHQQLGELANEVIADQDNSSDTTSTSKTSNGKANSNAAANATTDETSKSDSNKKDQKASSSDTAKSVSATNDAERSEPALHNDDIEKVEVIKREADTKPEDAATQDAHIHEQLDALADEMISHNDIDSKDVNANGADKDAAANSPKATDSKKAANGSAKKAKSSSVTNAKGKK